MRRALVALALVLGTAATASADQPAIVEPMPGPSDGWEQPKAYDQLSERERERELQQQQWSGPSGFWTSPHKSAHGAYRYRMMGIGVVLLLGMGWLMLRLIRRANADRMTRS